MGQVLYILFSIPLTEKEEAARAVCLGSHAARGDYGDCDSASVGSHATARCLWLRSRDVVEVVARLARCARSGRCS